MQLLLELFHLYSIAEDICKIFEEHLPPTAGDIKIKVIAPIIFNFSVKWQSLHFFGRLFKIHEVIFL